MITSYELVYIRFLAIQIQTYKLVHNLTIQIHSSPPAAPAAATTAHNAGATTVATGRHITWCSQRIAEENEVGRRSRYVLLNLYDFFYTIYRMLICMIFSNHIRTRNMDSYVGAIYTNLYHLHLVTIYELLYTSTKYYNFVWLPHTNLYISACRLYEFHPTNLYII
jgi:hypothetical protein